MTVIVFIVFLILILYVYYLGYPEVALIYLGIVLYLVNINPDKDIVIGGGQPNNIRLVDIRESHFNDIRKLTSNIDVMKWVGNGKIWDARQLSNFMKYNAIEQKQSPDIRTSYYYAIEYDASLAGIVGIHKLDYGDHQRGLTIYIDPAYQGRGIARQVIAMLAEKFGSFVIDTRYDNEAMQHVALACGAKKIDELQISGKPYYRYKIGLSN